MAELGWITGTARAIGGSRNFRLWIPGTLEKGHASPLVMMLHGCTHDAEDMAEISGCLLYTSHCSPPRVRRCRTMISLCTRLWYVE